MAGIIPGSSELLLRLNGTDNGLLQQVLQSYLLTELFGTPRLKQRGWVRVQLPLGRLLVPLLRLLHADPRVRDALPNLALVGTSVDPYLYRQWNLRSMKAGEAWMLQPDARGVVVAVLDTGLSPGPDLADTPILQGYDFVNQDANPSDDHQHGTMMASILAASVGNGHAVAGVAPEATLLPVKVLDSRKLGTTAALVEGLYYAAEQGAHVVNLSLAYAPGVYPGAVLDEALESLRSGGIVVVAAAGNYGAATVSYPAAHPAVIAVGATQPTTGFAGDARASYSNYGTALDLQAPGGGAEDVDGDGRIDAILGETFDHENPSVYEVYATAGTSGAAAQVSGAAALLLASAATTTVSVRAALENTAAGPGGFTPGSGAGSVDLHAALQGWLDGQALENEAISSLVTLHEEFDVFGLLQLEEWIRAVATVEVRDARGALLPGVWVYGHFAGASGSSRSIRTGATGKATFTSSAYRAGWRSVAGIVFVVDRVTPEGQPFEADADQSWLASPSGALWLLLQSGLDWLLGPQGALWLIGAPGQDWLLTSAGTGWLMTPAGHGWLMTPAGHGWLMTPAGHDWLLTSAGSGWLMTPAGHGWLMTPAGHDLEMVPAD